MKYRNVVESVQKMSKNDKRILRAKISGMIRDAKLEEALSDVRKAAFEALEAGVSDEILHREVHFALHL